MTITNDARKVFLYSLSVMFILIGIAAVLSVIFSPHSFPNTLSGWIGVAGSVIGALIALFFLFILIWVIIWLARSLGWISRVSSYSNHDQWRFWDHDEAMEILRERYAKGEISKEEYDRMREDLRREGGNR